MAKKAEKAKEKDRQEERKRSRPSPTHSIFAETHQGACGLAIARLILPRLFVWFSEPKYVSRTTIRICL